jgi:Holliday junction resolvase-like predicted endonuclease
MTRATGRRTPAQSAGAAAEDFAERLLVRHGLQVLARNYRTRFGEIDLVARHYLSRLPREPACRFDVVSLEGGEPKWLRAAFEG